MADHSEEHTDYYGVETTPHGFVVVDGRNEFPAALRHTRRAAEAVCRQLNGEPPLPNDPELLNEPLYNQEFGPITKETTCFFQ